MLDLFLKGQVKDIQVWGLFVEEENHMEVWLCSRATKGGWIAGLCDLELYIKFPGAVTKQILMSQLFQVLGDGS